MPTTFRSGFAPSRAGDPRFRRWLARFQRTVASPRTVQAFLRASFEMDARPILPLIQAPTLVRHRRDFEFIPIAHGRYLAVHVAARMMATADPGEILVSRSRSARSAQSPRTSRSSSVVSGHR